MESTKYNIYQYRHQHRNHLSAEDFKNIQDTSHTLVYINSLYMSLI